MWIKLHRHKQEGDQFVSCLYWWLADALLMACWCFTDVLPKEGFSGEAGTWAVRRGGEKRNLSHILLIYDAIVPILTKKITAQIRWQASRIPRGERRRVCPVYYRYTMQHYWFYNTHFTTQIRRQTRRTPRGEWRRVSPVRVPLVPIFIDRYLCICDFYRPIEP